MSPLWRPDGKELYFLGLDGMAIAVGIDTTGGITATIPSPMIPTAIRSAQDFHPWAISADGKRFLVKVPEEIGPERPIIVTLDWRSLTARRQ